ncbi:MAG: ribonuclease Y [bacterium]
MNYLTVLIILLIIILAALSVIAYKMYKLIEANQSKKSEPPLLLDQQNNTQEIISQKIQLEKEVQELLNTKNTLYQEIQKANENLRNIENEIQNKTKQKESITQEINNMLQKARKEAEEINKKAIDKLDSISREWENIQKQKQDLWEKEKQITVFQKELEIKKQSLEEQLQQINQKEQKIKQTEIEIEELKKTLENELEKVASLTQEQAREIILKRVEEQIRSELQNVALKIEQEAQKNAEQKAKRIILNTLSRITSDSVAENTTYSIVLPSEDLKGRIIGKEGRNIKAFEEITGVDLIIDDNSEVVFVSSFDPIRREKARLTLEKLISIGKINPIAIQEVYDQIEKEINIRIQEEGENACLQAKVFDLHPDLVYMVGKMKYRTSYGQNLLKHSIQVATIAATLASEIGANVEVCRRAAFLHDIGKVIEDSNGEPHAIAGAKIAKMYGEREEVVRAIASHHNEVPQETIEDLIVQVADSISASRPGARKETFQLYIQRLQKLEEIAMGFNGVEKAFVLQGGREVIVFVKPDIVADNAVYNLARDISKAIENNLRYPGVIRVTVIRKVIAVQVAR